MPNKRGAEEPPKEVLQEGVQAGHKVAQAGRRTGRAVHSSGVRQWREGRPACPSFATRAGGGFSTRSRTAPARRTAVNRMAVERHTDVHSRATCSHRGTASTLWFSSKRVVLRGYPAGCRYSFHNVARRECFRDGAPAECPRQRARPAQRRCSAKMLLENIEVVVELGSATAGEVELASDMPALRVMSPEETPRPQRLPRSSSHATPTPYIPTKPRSVRARKCAACRT